MAGDRRNQRLPYEPGGGTVGGRELEEVDVRTEQSQAASPVVVCQRLGAVVETVRVQVRHFGLESLGELADIVQAEQEADERCSLVSRQIQQAKQTVAQTVMLRKQGFADRGYVEAMKRQRMPPWSTVGIAGPGFSPEGENSRVGLGHVVGIVECPRRPRPAPPVGAPPAAC